MRQADALLLVALVARCSWNGSLESEASSDEVARAWNEATQANPPVSAQTMGRRLAKLADAGLLERRREGGTNGDHGWSMWRCSRNVRELVRTVDADQRAQPARVV